MFIYFFKFENEFRTAEYKQCAAISWVRAHSEIQCEHRIASGNTVFYIFVFIFGLEN